MAQNDFLQFDETQENTLTQEAYSTDVQRVGGVSSGLARSALFNKVMRQASTFVAGFGNFLAEKNINILEDLESVKTALTNLFTAKNVGVSTEVQDLLGVDNVDAVLNIVSNKTLDSYNKVNKVYKQYYTDGTMTFGFENNEGYFLQTENKTFGTSGGTINFNINIPEVARICKIVITRIIGYTVSSGWGGSWYYGYSCTCKIGEKELSVGGLSDNGSGNITVHENKPSTTLFVDLSEYAGTEQNFYFSLHDYYSKNNQANNGYGGLYSVSLVIPDLLD